MRRYLPQALIWIVGIGLALWVWFSAAQVLATEQAPLRPMQLVLADGTISQPYDVFCQDADSVTDGESYWFGPCALEVLDNQQAMLRVYPAEGRIDARWVFPAVSGLETGAAVSLDTFRTMARSATGEVFAQFSGYSGEPAVATFHHFILHSAGVDAVEAPPIPVDMRGAAWVGTAGDQSVELISVQPTEDGEAPPDLLRYTPGEGWQTDSIPLPEACSNCRLQLAYREGDAWRLLYLELPAETPYPGEDGQVLTLPLSSVILADETGAALPLELESNRLDDAQSDTLIVTPMLFDRAVGNLDSIRGHHQLGSIRAVPYVYRAGRWIPMPLPAESLYADVVSLDDVFISVYGNNQTMLDAQSQWQPRLGAFPDDFYDFVLLELEGRWLRLQFTSEGAAIRDEGRSGSLTSPYFTLSPVVIPTQESDFWIIDSIYRPDGTLHLTGEFTRLDTPNVIERFQILLADPGATPWEQSKTSALFALAGLPVLLLVLLARRRHALKWGWVWLPLAYGAITLLSLELVQRFVRAL